MPPSWLQLDTSRVEGLHRGQVGRQVKSAYEPSGSSGWILSPSQQHEVTRSISTPALMGCYFIAGLPLSINFTGSHLYSWVERGTVRVKCIAQEHNTMSLVRAQTRIAHSGVKRPNHEASVPPTLPWAGGRAFYFPLLLPSPHSQSLGKFTLEVHQYGGSILGSVNLCKIFCQISEVQKNTQT